MIAAFTRAVQGNPDDVVRLVLDENATDEDAERLAMNWLSREHSEHIDRIAAAMMRPMFWQLFVICRRSWLVLNVLLAGRTAAHKPIFKRPECRRSHPVADTSDQVHKLKK